MSLSKSEAARINGASSKGPISIEGKARSSQNALKHGLTAENVVAGGEELTDYTEVRDAYIEQFQPDTQLEVDLVETLAATRVRLRRVVRVETGILDHKIAEVDRHDIPTAFERVLPSLTLLSRYESALQRTFDRALKQLQAIQKARLAHPPQELRNEPSPLPDIIGFPSPTPSSPASDGGGYENLPHEPKNDDAPPTR